MRALGSSIYIGFRLDGPCGKSRHRRELNMGRLYANPLLVEGDDLAVNGQVLGRLSNSRAGCANRKHGTD
jgi:hypothetical protein